MLVVSGLAGCGDVHKPVAIDAPEQPVDAAEPIDAPPPRTAPPPGHVLWLPGDGYMIADSLSAAMTASPAMTVNAWVRPNPVQPGTDAVVAAFNGGGSANQSLMQWIGDGYNYFDDDGASYMRSGGTIAPGVWHHVSFVVDAAGAGLVYQNGEPIMTFTTTRRITATSRFSLGQEWDAGGPTDFFAGFVDEVTVWSVARSRDQVVAEMAGGPALGDANLVAYFPFESAAADASGHGYDGTLRATAAVVATP